MVTAPIFLCIGFMIAVLYLDLVFDTSVLPHRQTKAPLPPDVLDPMATYYRYVTRNPYLLMFVMLTTTTCILAQIVYDLLPRWAGYSSLLLMGLSMLGGVLKVIPTAQRLAAGKDAIEQRTRMAHSMVRYHIALLISILLLVAVQFSATLE